MGPNVLAGLSVKLDDEVLHLSPLDVVRVDPGIVRAFEAGSDGLEVLVVGPHVEADAEIIRDLSCA